MATSQNIIIITGGNGGIGFELASQLMTNKLNHVIIGSRSVEKGNAAVKDLQSRGHPGSVEMVQLNVDSHDSISNAAKTVKEKYGKIDVLVNNAAVAGTSPDETPVRTRIRNCLITNALGSYMMIEEFAPLLKASKNPTPRIVNVSSGIGSITRCLDPTSPMYNFISYDYGTSKAALNMITAQAAVEYGKMGWKVFAVCPGFTVSNLSGFNTAANGAKPVSEGAAIITKVVNGERDAEHGCFLKESGQYEW